MDPHHHHFAGQTGSDLRCHGRFTDSRVGKEQDGARTLLPQYFGREIQLGVPANKVLSLHGHAPG
jgi:hypothetical protein